MIAKYINKSNKHFTHGHEYELYIKPPNTNEKKYCYLVHTVYDKTAETEVDFYDNFASQISLKQNFQSDKFDIDNND